MPVEGQCFVDPKAPKINYLPSIHESNSSKALCFLLFFTLLVVKTTSVTLTLGCMSPNPVSSQCCFRVLYPPTLNTQQFNTLFSVVNLHHANETVFINDSLPPRLLTSAEGDS